MPGWLAGWPDFGWLPWPAGARILRLSKTAGAAIITGDFIAVQYN
jgi:hypothetical protein